MFSSIFFVKKIHDTYTYSFQNCICLIYSILRALKETRQETPTFKPEFGISSCTGLRKTPIRL